jgi:effector-binding domain-containing protein
MSIEEAKYQVVTKDGKFEIRDYAPQILAEIVVAADLEQAGNKAFRTLFRYISGANRSRDKIAMTAPVSQESSSQKIEMSAPVSQQPSNQKIKMTAPVGQQPAQNQWAVSFTMPASYTMETLPQPDDPKITLRQVPARRMAAVRYSGFWSEKKYQRNKKELEAWMRAKGLNIAGDPVWARYNPPFTLWFLRRNEILFPTAAGTGHEMHGNPTEQER